MRIPKNKFDNTKINQKFITLEVETGDGEISYFKGYTAKIALGKKEFTGTLILTEKGEELVLGMEILNELVSNFDGPSKKLTIYMK